MDNGLEERLALAGIIEQRSEDEREQCREGQSPNDRNGQRFLMVKNEAGAGRLNVVLNAFADLSR